MKEIILKFIINYKGHWNNVYEAIAEKKAPIDDNLIKLDEQILNETVCINEDIYFDKFKQMYMPPFALHFYGNKDLLNNKVFGILGNVDDRLIPDLKIFRDHEYTICVKASNISEAVINTMLKLGFQLIIIYDRKLTTSEQRFKIENNIVCISEYITEEIIPDQEQNVERILYAISDDIYLKSKYEENVKIIFENYEHEKKNCYLIFETKFNELIQKMIEKGMIKVIKSLDEIIKK